MKKVVTEVDSGSKPPGKRFRSSMMGKPKAKPTSPRRTNQVQAQERIHNDLRGALSLN